MSSESVIYASEACQTAKRAKDSKVEKIGKELEGLSAICEKREE